MILNFSVHIKSAMAYILKFSKILAGLGGDAGRLAKAISNSPANLGKLIKTAVDSNPDAIAKAIGKMKSADATNLLKNLDETTQLKLLKSLDEVDPATANKLRKNLSKKIPNAKDIAKQALTIGAGAGALFWVDQKFKDASEKFKDCMAGCVPENWDEYDSGSLEKSDLKYSNLESLTARDMEPIENQPYCTEKIDNCGIYCKQKCDAESEVDLPGSDLFGGGGKFVGGLFGDTFSGLLDGLGLGDFGGGVGTAVSSGASLISSCMMLIVVFVMLRK